MSSLARNLIAAEARKILATRRFSDYLALIDPAYDATLEHSRAIVAHLQALADGDIENLAIVMPPQHGKSYHFSEHFPAWYMGVHPSRWVAIGAYTGTRADAASEKCRDQLNDPRWPFAGVTLGAKRRADEWSTNYRGEMHSAGIGGSLTGFGANLLAIDDPIKGRQQAYSLTYRDGAWDWYTTVARTRARTPFHQLLGLTRWHDDDLLGRIMNTKGWKSWTLLRLPAIAEADDPLGRTIGEPLWPEDLGGPPLPQVQLGEISSKDFAALYQGDPSPTDGDVFRASWLERKWRDFDHVLDRAVGLYVALDGAWKEGVENDMSALATWALHETEGFGREFSLVHGWTARVDYPKLKRIVRGYAEEFMPTALLVEDAASGIPLVQELRPSSDFPVIGVPTGRASKLARAEAITPLFESGKCAIPDKPSPWLTEWISQHLRFDAGKRDDFVDTTSLALGYMNRTPRRTWGKIDTANRRSN